MKSRKRMVQAIAIIAMAAALGLTAKPAVAAPAPRFCTAMCATSCAEAFCTWPCMTMGCSSETCQGVDGMYYPAAVDCR
jgi:integral membrane sensor domain MASE1